MAKGIVSILPKNTIKTINPLENGYFCGEYLNGHKYTISEQDVSIYREQQHEQYLANVAYAKQQANVVLEKIDKLDAKSALMDERNIFGAFGITLAAFVSLLVTTDNMTMSTIGATATVGIPLAIANLKRKNRYNAYKEELECLGGLIFFDKNQLVLGPLRECVIEDLQNSGTIRKNTVPPITINSVYIYRLSQLKKVYNSTTKRAKNSVLFCKNAGLTPEERKTLGDILGLGCEYRLPVQNKLELRDVSLFEYNPDGVEKGPIKSYSS